MSGVIPHKFRDGTIAEFIFDDDKAVLVSRLRRCVYRNNYGSPYMYVMHGGARLPVTNYITGAPRGTTVDHINRVTTDNRLENLRPCTLGQNMRNRVVKANHTPGVYWEKSARVWCACLAIRIDGSSTRIRERRRFKNKDDAIACRRQMEAAAGISWAVRPDGAPYALTVGRP